MSRPRRPGTKQLCKTARSTNPTALQDSESMNPNALQDGAEQGCRKGFTRRRGAGIPKGICKTARKRDVVISCRSWIVAEGKEVYNMEYIAEFMSKGDG